MKRLFLVLSLLLVFFIGYNVYAEGENEPFEAGEYKYTVENFKLRVYSMVLQEDGTTDTESFSKFISGRFDKEIDIDENDIPFEPTSEEKKVDTINAQVANLHANITEEKIRELLSEEITDAASGTKSYIVELVVNFKVLEAPEKFRKYYEVDFYKEFIKGLLESLSSESTGLESNVREVQLNELITLPIQYIGIAENEFKFYQTARETVPPSSLFNYVVFSETEYVDENEPTDILMLVNVPDIDYLLDQVGDLFSSDYNNTSEIVLPVGDPIITEKIPDTAMDKNVIVLIAGILLIIIGSTIVISKVITRHN